MNRICFYSKHTEIPSLLGSMTSPWLRQEQKQELMAEVFQQELMGSQPNQLKTVTHHQYVIIKNVYM